MCSIAVYYAALRARWPYIQMAKLHARTLTLAVIILKSKMCLKLKCQLKCNKHFENGNPFGRRCGWLVGVVCCCLSCDVLFTYFYTFLEQTIPLWSRRMPHLHFNYRVIILVLVKCRHFRTLRQAFNKII